MAIDQNWLPTENNISDYLLLEELLSAQKQEFDILSKKKSDGQLNKMKMMMANRVLAPIKEILKNEPSYGFLDILNEDDMPTNSDLVLIISQYEKAMSNFREKYFLIDRLNIDKYGDAQARWSTKENPVQETEEEEDDE